MPLTRTALVTKLITVGLTTVITSGSVAAQTHATFARLQPGNFVEILDQNRNAWRQIYQAKAWSTNGISVGPGRRLALLAWAEGIVAGHGYAKPPQPRLVVIDTAGRELAPPVQDVQRYAWCGPSCIVYITGRFEENDTGFLPDQVAMLDVATGKTTSLPKPPFPIGITWGAFDNAAYVKNLPREGEAEIYRLDIAARTLEPTQFKDHLFSPTGRYYLHRPEFSDSLIVYETLTNTPVDLSQIRQEVKLLGWSSANEDLLLTARREPKSRDGHGAYRAGAPGEKKTETTYKLYDVRTKRVRATLTGNLDRWVGPDHQRLLQQGGRYRVLEPE